MNFSPKRAKKVIYLDHAATTPLAPEVERAMQPYWRKNYGNPSSLYSLGIEAKQAIEDSKETLSKILNCRSSEIVFTAGGTESVNLALFGVVRKHPGAHIISSKIEHHAVLHSLDQLKKEGFEISYLRNDSQGFVNPKELRKLIKKNTLLVSVMLANNEVGTIEPIEKIAKELRAINSERVQKNLPRILLHTDACQAGGVLNLDVNRLGIDLMSLNGSKLYGPKQIGLLYVRKGTEIEPVIFGGEQENNLRSGTENVPAIVGLAKAFEIAEKNKAKENNRERKLRNYFIQQLFKKIPDLILNGAPIKDDSEKNPIRLPNNINISIKNVEGEALLLYLDAHGICISTGSACTSTSADPSHVILALGNAPEFTHGLRFTLGRATTKAELDKVLKILPGLVAELRRVKEMDLALNQSVEFSIRNK